MTYRLKTIRYQNTERRILLQNENGPCPLLAAANALLLKGICTLPPSSIRNGVASLEDVANMLAEQAMKSTDATDQHHAIYVDELVQYIPKFQYGMDVNPSFTQGITGYEYTAHLTAFDMLRCKLVHGWLVDVEDEDTFRAIGGQTYNQLVERIIVAQETNAELEKLSAQKQEIEEEILLGDTSNEPKLAELQIKMEGLHKTLHESVLIQQFLESTGHQLTHYGLLQLHESLKVGELCVFFRNNHFGTLTKHEDGHLYLLVTDLGYANSPAIVWERLDVIDGNTDYVNSDFKTSGTEDRLLATGPTLTPEQMMAASSRNDADYQLALRLSMAENAGAGSLPVQQQLDEQEGQIMAAVTEASLREYHGLGNIMDNNTVPGQDICLEQQRVETGQPIDITTSGTQIDADHLLAVQMQQDHAFNNNYEDASLQLARQLQEEENQRAAAAQRHTPPQRRIAASGGSSSGSSGCVLS